MKAYEPFLLVIYVVCIFLVSFINIHDYCGQGCYPFECGDSVVVVAATIVSLFAVVAPIVSGVLFLFRFPLSEEERAS